MDILLKLIAALLPAVLLWIFIWKKDLQPEPIGWLLKAVLLGMATVLPLAFLEHGLDIVLFGPDGKPSTLMGTTVKSFVVAALPEEAFKLLALWLVLRKNSYFDEHFDGIVYAVCVGLGFAAVENVIYVFSEDEWVGVAIARALLAVPGHYAFAVLMGYYYSVYHFVDHSPKVALCILLVPVMAHGVYDSLALSGVVDETVGGLCFFILVWFCRKMHKEAKAKVLAMIDRDNKNNISL